MAIASTVIVVARVDIEEDIEVRGRRIGRVLRN
jgi:hypothetical protein